MKTIIYLLIAVFLFGTVVSCLNNNTKEKKSILIECSNNNASVSDLEESKKILADRLSEFGSDQFDISVISKKNQIQIDFNKDFDLTGIENLITQKGSLGFYLACDQMQINDILKNDSNFLLLFNTIDTAKNEGIIGSVTTSEMKKINDYLQNSGLDKKGKFAWAKNDDQLGYSLYALDTKPVLSGSDIETITSVKSKTTENPEIMFEFNQQSAKIWAEVTSSNINRVIAIILDDQVLFAPVIRAEIANGKCSLTGNFTPNQVKQFVAIVKGGELPVGFKVVK